MPCTVNIEGFTFSEDAIICFIKIAFAVFYGFNERNKPGRPRGRPGPTSGRPGTVVTPRGKGRDKAASRRKASREKRKEKKRTSTNPLAPKDLLVTGGPLVGTMLPLGEAPIVIGRSPACTLVLEDEYASSPRGVTTVPKMSRRSVLTAASTRSQSSTRNPMRKTVNATKILFWTHPDQSGV